VLVAVSAPRVVGGVVTLLPLILRPVKSSDELELIRCRDLAIRPRKSEGGEDALGVGGSGIC